MAGDWVQEPTSFLSVALDAPLGMPECPTYPGIRSAKLYDTLAEIKSKQMCFEEVTPKLTEIRNAPDIGVPVIHFTAATSDDGKVGSILLTIPHFKRQDMLELLRARYGEPSRTLSQEVASAAGARLTGMAYEWVGRRIVLSFREYGARIDESVVSVITTAYVQAEKASSSSRAQANKDKL